MVEVNVRGAVLSIRVRGLHALWALKRELEVPLRAVTRVGRPSPHVLRNPWKGLRAPGTHFPGLLVAGTYYRRGERHFWDVRRKDRAIEIDLAGAEYDRIYVEVDDPELAITEIRMACEALT
jgi:hypothetical protein